MRFRRNTKNCGSGSRRFKNIRILRIRISAKKCPMVIKACFICSRWKFFVQKLKAPCGLGGGDLPKRGIYRRFVRTGWGPSHSLVPRQSPIIRPTSIVMHCTQIFNVLWPWTFLWVIYPNKRGGGEERILQETNYAYTGIVTVCSPPTPHPAISVLPIFEYCSMSHTSNVWPFIATHSPKSVLSPRVSDPHWDPIFVYLRIQVWIRIQKLWIQ